MAIHLDILKEIYEKDVATGAQAESAREKVQRWERESRDMNIDEMQGNDEVHLENFHPFDNESATATPMSTEYSSELKEMSVAMNKIADAILNTSNQVWRPAEIFEEVRKLGLEGRTLFDAYEWLVANPNLVGVFFGFPEEYRLEWLATKLGC